MVVTEQAARESASTIRNYLAARILRPGQTVDIRDLLLALTSLRAPQLSAGLAYGVDRGWWRSADLGCIAVSAQA